MKVPLLDLKAQFRRIKPEIMQEVEAVFDSQYFILGPKVRECEQRVAGYCRSEYGVGVSSGTDALLLAMMAEGIGAGDAVITTPYTFFATAGSIARLGATPVFVDIDPATFNMAADDIERVFSPRVKAILPVHLYGQTAEMKPILDIAAAHGAAVIEDAAQAIGAEYTPGTRAGSMGDYGCFSFFPSKNLGAAGDAGFVTTRDSGKYERLLALRVHGSKPKYYHKAIGGNFRLDALQAVVISTKLKYLDSWSDARGKNAEKYVKLFRDSGYPVMESRELRPGAPPVSDTIVTPSIMKHRHVFNQFVIRVPRRDALKAHLLEKGIGTEIYYPVPLHLQECFRYLGYKEGDFPESEKASKETLALPIYPELTDEQLAYVVESIVEFLK